MRIFDVAVVGLGPAGSTASYLLKKGGLDVLAFDRESFPRYKPCGGCLSKKIDGLLDLDFKDVVERTVKGAVFTHAFERELTILSDETVGYMVQRDRFDALLMERAGESGVEVRTGEGVKSLEDKGSHIEITTTKGSYSARCIIGADGPFSIVARTFFPDLKRRKGLSIEGEAEAIPDLLERLKTSVWIDFGYIPHGYGWVFPKEKTLSIGIAGLQDEVEDIKRYFEGFLKGCGLNRLRFFKIKGWIIPAFTQEGGCIAKDRVVLVGDAANLVDPFLGEGIYWAIRSAMIVSDGILKMWDTGIKPDRIHDAVDREIGREFRSATKVANLVYGYPDLWYEILERKPSLIGEYFEVLRGRKDYEEFLDIIKGKLKESYPLWLKIVFSHFALRLKRFLGIVSWREERGGLT